MFTHGDRTRNNLSSRLAVPNFVPTTKLYQVILSVIQPLKTLVGQGFRDTCSHFGTC